MFTLQSVTYKNILRIGSLVLPAQKVLCIVGESGSGKTTLLRLLNKMISPDSGEIYYGETPLSSISSVELRRSVVMLQQNPAIFPGTVADNLQAGLRFAEKAAASEDKLRAALSMVHLPKELDNDAEKLSGGEKQRLALGRLLLLEPEVMLLDEPSSALDEATEQSIIRSLVTYTRQHNRTLIMVTHAKQVARDYAQHIFEMRSGAIIGQEEVGSNAGNH